jgi:hypothetical protein
MRREEDRSSILSGAGRGDPLNGRDKLSGGRAVFFRLCLKLTAAGSGKQNGRNNTRMNNVVTGQLQQQGHRGWVNKAAARGGGKPHSPSFSNNPARFRSSEDATRGPIFFRIDFTI